MNKKIQVIKDYLASTRSYWAKANNYYRMKDIDDIYQFVDLVERTKEEDLDFFIMNYLERLARPKKACDYHQEFVEQFIEYPPFAVDEETGEVLNKTSQPILVRVADKNLYEEIQSYKDDVDIYNILKQYAETGDESLINRRVSSFMDIADIPDNINELHGYFEAKAKLLNEFSPEDQNVILNGENVDALIDRKVKELLVAKGINVENKGDEDAK